MGNCPCLSTAKVSPEEIILPKSVYDRQKLIDRAMPPWAIPNPKVDAYTLQLVAESWTQVTNGEGLPFKVAKATDKSLTSLVFFHNTFYNTFFSIAPEVKPYFSNGIKVQGQVLANILTFIVKCAGESLTDLVQVLKHIAIIHNKMNIPAHHYAVVGQVLLMTLSKCLGEELFTSEVRYAWTMVYSQIMEVMIPVVIDGKKEHDKETLFANYKEAIRTHVKKPLPDSKRNTGTGSGPVVRDNSSQNISVMELQTPKVSPRGPPDSVPEVASRKGITGLLSNKRRTAHVRSSSQDLSPNIIRTLDEPSQ